MSYHTSLVFLHMFFVTLFIGSVAVLWLQWRQYRMADTEKKILIVESMVLTSKKITVMGGSFLFLAGVLIIIMNPGILTVAGSLFLTKLALGIAAVALSHVTHGLLRRIHEGLLNSEQSDQDENKLTQYLAMVGVTSILALLLGFIVIHG